MVCRGASNTRLSGACGQVAGTGQFMPPAFLSFHQTMKVILPDQGVRVMEESPGTVGALLHEIGINPLEVIVSRNGKLVPEQAAIGGDDEIRIIRIAHGG